MPIVCANCSSDVHMAPLQTSSLGDDRCWPRVQAASNIITANVAPTARYLWGMDMSTILYAEHGAGSAGCSPISLCRRMPRGSVAAAPGLLVHAVPTI